MKTVILIFWIFIFYNSAFSQGEKVFLSTINSSDLEANVSYILYSDLELNDTLFDFRMVHFYRHGKYAYSYLLNTYNSNSYYSSISGVNLFAHRFSQTPAVLLIINEKFSKKETFIMYGNPSLSEAALENDMVGSNRKIFVKFPSIGINSKRKKKK